VRWTSTSIPGYATSNSLATFSALERASDVYHTTWPSFFAASTLASCADASGRGVPAAIIARAAAAETTIEDVRRIM